MEQVEKSVEEIDYDLRHVDEVYKSIRSKRELFFTPLVFVIAVCDLVIEKSFKLSLISLIKLLTIPLVVTTKVATCLEYIVKNLYFILHPDLRYSGYEIASDMPQEYRRVDDLPTTAISNKIS